MVDEIRPDPGQVDDGRDSQCLEFDRCTDAGASEDHRAGVRSGREYDAIGFDEGPVEKADTGDAGRGPFGVTAPPRLRREGVQLAARMPRSRSASAQ